MPETLPSASTRTSAVRASEDHDQATPAREHAPGERRPVIVFAFRFGNATGFVQRFFAQRADLVAGVLQGKARVLLAFVEALDARPAVQPRWSEEVRADFFDWSDANRKRIADFIRENGVAVIVFQSSSPGEIDIGFLRGLGVGTVNTEDSSHDHTRTQPFVKTAGKFVQRRLLKHGIHDVHVSPSNGHREFLAHFAQLPRERLHMVHNGIDPDFYAPGDRGQACAELGLEPEMMWIMAASQARPEKRVDQLIRVVSRARTARPDKRVGFLFVGAGEFLEEWSALARTLLPAANQRFFGRQTDLRVFYRAASLFIHGASKESFCLVLAEAMACELPVVATYAHGPADIVEDGRTGFLVGRDDWDAFLAAVLRYIDDAALRQSHGAAGRQRCIANFTSDGEAAGIAALIEGLLPRR